MGKKIISKMLMIFLLIGIVATMTFCFSVKHVYSNNAEPLLGIEKSGPDFADPGDMITYTIVVENLADVSLDGVLVEDQLLGFNWQGDLSIGEMNIFEPSFMVPEDAEGPLTNIATVWVQIDNTVFYAEASWTIVVPIAPTINSNPDTLNLGSMGKWITAYIELPEGYDVGDIDRTTVLLNGTIPVDSFWLEKPSVIGDYDEDGVPDLMVKFDRAAVKSYVLASTSSDSTFFEVTLTITGSLNDGTMFEGSDRIRAILHTIGPFIPR